MKHSITLALLLFAIVVCAQQNIGFSEQAIVSPVISEESHLVTFRIQAPKAETVEVFGDWEQGEGHLVLARNAEGIWEGSLADLPSEMYIYRVCIDGVMGLDPTNPFVRRDVGTQFSVFYVSGGVADYYQVHEVPHGSLTTAWYDSKTAGVQRRLSIYTPANYSKSIERYPVLYLLHGSGGDEEAWVELGNTVRIMDNLIAQKKIKPMMVVMPNGNFGVQAAPGETSENLGYRPVMSHLIPGNYKNGDYEMSFGEIVSYIDSHYRTLSDKQHRAIAGLSMGGFHSLFIALNHPEKFNYVGLFSAGLGNHFVNEEVEAYCNQDEKLKRLQHLGYNLFWIAIGKDDFLYDANTEFRAHLDEMGFRYEYKETTRGHLWINWRQYLVEFSQKLFK